MVAQLIIKCFSLLTFFTQVKVQLLIQPIKD